VNRIVKILMMQEVVLSKDWHESQAWWCKPVITAFGRLRQEDSKFKASLGCTARHCFKKQKRKADMSKEPRKSRWVGDDGLEMWLCGKARS
jgi:hypothetical protein